MQEAQLMDIGVKATEGFRASAGSPAGPGGIYRGWYNVILGVIGVMLVMGATSYSFGLFIKPVSESLGLSRASTNLGLVLFNLGSALASPFAGRMLDRYPVLMIQRIGAALFGAGLIGLGLASSPIILGALIVGPVAFGAVASGAMFANVLVTRWFYGLRGRALTITAMGTSLGGMLIFPIIGMLISVYSWRTALIVTGIASCLILWLLSALAHDRPPPAQCANADGAPVSATEAAETTRLTMLEVLRLRDFWFIALAICLLLGVDQALLATVTPYTQDRGFSLAQTTAIMSATTASAIAGKFLIAWIADRFDLRVLLALTALCTITMCLALVSQPSYLGLLLTSSLTGMAVGGTFPLGNAMIARRFGAASVGTAIGLKMPLVNAASMGTLYFVGLMHDRNGSYDIAFLAFAGMAVLAIVLMPFIRLPRPELN